MKVTDIVFNMFGRNVFVLCCLSGGLDVEKGKIPLNRLPHVILRRQLFVDRLKFSRQPLVLTIISIVVYRSCPRNPIPEVVEIGVQGSGWKL